MMENHKYLSFFLFLFLQHEYLYVANYGLQVTCQSKTLRILNLTNQVKCTNFLLVRDLY